MTGLKILMIAAVVALLVLIDIIVTYVSKGMYP